MQRPMKRTPVKVVNPRKRKYMIVLGLKICVYFKIH